MAKPVRLTLIALSAVLILGYLVGVFLTRDIWTGREGTRVTFAAQPRDGAAPSPDAMAKGAHVVGSALTERGVSDVDVTAGADNLTATYSGHDLDADALRDLLGSGDAKTLYVRPVIHAIPAEAAPGASSHVPAPPSDPAQAIADERALRQSTEQQIQLLGLQFQATRCRDDDVLASHDDPHLPLITCSADGKTAYLLDRSIIGGDEVSSAGSGRDTQRGEYVVDLEFGDAATRTWAEYTAEHVGTQTAFTIDTRVLSAPQIKEAIPGGRTQITGQFDAESARALADALNRGALPLTLTYESSTDATLPQSASANLMRIIVIGAGVSVAVLVLGAAVFLRRRS
jgi:protein-export membrane protein SecD